MTVGRSSTWPEVSAAVVLSWIPVPSSPPAIFIALLFVVHHSAACKVKLELADKAHAIN